MNDLQVGHVELVNDLAAVADLDRQARALGHGLGRVGHGVESNALSVFSLFFLCLLDAALGQEAKLAQHLLVALVWLRGSRPMVQALVLVSGQLFF